MGRAWSRIRRSGTVGRLVCHLPALLLGQVPRQERGAVRRSLATRLGTALQVPRQPLSWIDLPLRQGGQQRKEHRRQASAPQRARTIVVLPAHSRSTLPTLGSVVVQRNAHIVHEAGQSDPVLLETYQHLAAAGVQPGIGQLRGRLRLHGRQALPQGRVSRGQLLPTLTKSRRTCAQQKTKTMWPPFTWAIAL